MTKYPYVVLIAMALGCFSVALSDSTGIKNKGLTLVDTTGWGAKYDKLEYRLKKLEAELDSLKKQDSRDGVIRPDTTGLKMPKIRPENKDDKMVVKPKQ